MSTRRTTMVGLLLLTAANLFQVISTYAFDWNKSHIYNPNWPPHAKFHNAQTMAMTVVLAVASLYFAWRKRGDASTNVLAAAIFGVERHQPANDHRPYPFGGRFPRLVPRA